jgi:hypothetical protein
MTSLQEYAALGLQPLCLEPSKTRLQWDFLNGMLQEQVALAIKCLK